MAWYSDEEFEFRKDCGEKKRIAASSHKQRTHCGKGGRVKFPSDFKTRKELNAMNGVCVTYKLGEPMKWDEFRALPNDKKVRYITWIREKFDAPDTAIAEMLGVNRKTLGIWITDLKLNRGQGANGDWDKDAFHKWVNPDGNVAGESGEGVVTEEIDISISPMSWTAFKALSDEEKIAYIQEIRKVFGANDTAIGEMMGVTQGPISKMMRTLGISLGKNSPLGGKRNWNREVFNRWAFPTRYLKTADDIAAEQEMKTAEDIAAEEVLEEIVETPVVEPSETVCEALEAPVSDVCEITEEVDVENEEVVEMPEEPEEEIDILEEVVEDLKRGVPEPITPIVAIPKSGSMTFESPACMAMATLQALLGKTNVRLKVEWEVIE